MILTFEKGNKVIATIKGGKFNGKKISILETKNEINKDNNNNSDSDSDSDSDKYDTQSSESHKSEIKKKINYPQVYDQSYNSIDMEVDLFGESGDIYPYQEENIGLINDDFYRQQKKYMTTDELDRIKKYILRNEEPDNESERKIVKKAKEKIKKTIESEIYVPDGFITPYLSDKTSRYFSAGPTGSGKSTHCANLIKQYKKQFPLNKVYLFSRIDTDPVLDEIKGMKRIMLDEDFIENPPDATKQFKNSLVIFDDVDTLVPKKLKDAVLRVREDILQVCRKFGTTLISTEHHLMNYKQTRNLLLDSEFITFFPKSGSVYHITRFLKTYAGLDKHQIKKVLSLNSRAVTLHKSYPQYIISDHNIYLLNAG